MSRFILVEDDQGKTKYLAPDNLIMLLEAVAHSVMVWEFVKNDEDISLNEWRGALDDLSETYKAVVIECDS